MKKLIALLLALTMVIGMVACGTQQETVETPAAETPAASTSDKVDEVPAETTAEREPGTLPLVDPAEGKTLTIALRQYPTTEDYDTNDYTLWLEEQTGINLEFVLLDFDADNATQQLNLMMAGGEKLPDIIMDLPSSLTTVLEYGEDGYLIDLMPYFENKEGYWFWEALEDITEENDKVSIFNNGKDPSTGALYAFPMYSSGGTDLLGNMVYINQTWLDNIGEDMPTTTDELYTVLQKFATEDPNGNGIADEIPMMGYVGGWRANITEYLVNAWVYCCDAYLFNVGDDGNLWLPYDTDEYREAMKYLNTIYTENLLNPMFYTITTGSEMQPLVTPADGTSLCGVIAMHPALCTVAESENFKEYVPMGPLDGNTDLGGYGVYRNNYYSYVIGITTDCEDPDLAFAFMDFLYSEEAQLRGRYGIPGEDWDYAEEGAVDFTGGPANIVVYDDTVFGTQNNKLWHSNYAKIFNTIDKVAYVSDGSWTSVLCDGYSAMFDAYRAAAKPTTVLPNLVYTAEENEIISEIKTLMGDYIQESRAMFASGVLDPNNDDDWNTYLNNLKAMRLYEYMELAQAAYDRTK